MRKMYVIEEILRQINEKKEELLTLPYDLEYLTEPILLLKSQELDSLISLYQRLKESI